MRLTKREEMRKQNPIRGDVIAEEYPEIGLVAIDGPNDPRPGIRIEAGRIVELDGKPEAAFDFIDRFIASYGIDINGTERAMAMDSLEIARMLVDIHVDRQTLVEICNGLTPAKLVDVVRQMNIVEIMMAQMKMRARKTPANQAHVVNLADNPVLLVADAAEAALRGFAEQETTCVVGRYAPLNALSLLVGSQIGRPGVITQCSMEEALELKLGMKGFTSYAETVSVYGTEDVMSDGDDTPWSKAFLAAAYASRGMKMRFSSGSGSEVMMGYAEGKSMLYLEARCVWLVKACGAQGTQNGAIDGLPVAAAMPSGLRAVAAESLMASMLGLEVASGNDTYFSHSDSRSMSKMLTQMLPGTDLVFSGYSSAPNSDNTFAGSTFDCDRYDEVYMVQRDLKVDGGIHPVDQDAVIEVRVKAAKTLQKLFDAMNFPEITDEEVDAAVYGYSSQDMPKRNVTEDLRAAESLMESEFNAFDVVRLLDQCGEEETAKRIMNLLKQRLTGDYLQTSAIFDAEFHVNSLLNNPNDYQGPGTGYQIDDGRWEALCKGMNTVNARAYASADDSTPRLFMVETGPAAQGQDEKEVVIAVSPTFGKEQTQTITGLPHSVVVRELAAGIEEEGLRARLIKYYASTDLGAISSAASTISGSGIGIGIQSKGTTVIHQKDLVPLDNLELFPQSPLYTAETYRHIGKNAAKYAKGESPQPIVGSIDPATRHYVLKATVLHNHDSKHIQPGKAPVELQADW